MRRLLIHADDLGLTAGVTKGIAEAMTQGVVTGTSAMVCSPQQRQLVAAAAPELRGRIGLHLQLTDGRPVMDPSRIPSLVDREGRFPAHRSQLTNPDPDEVLLEWRAQWQWLQELGISPAHIDTHHHVHAAPAVLEAYVQLAKEHQVRARVIPEGIGGNPREVRQRLRAAGVVCADFFTCIWTGRTPNLDSFTRALRVFAHLGGESCSLEIGCHPGYSDEELNGLSKYSSLREQELNVLCKPEMVTCIDEVGWTLCRTAEYTEDNLHSLINSSI